MSKNHICDDLACLYDQLMCAPVYTSNMKEDCLHFSITNSFLLALDFNVKYGNYVPADVNSFVGFFCFYASFAISLSQFHSLYSFKE